MASAGLMKVPLTRGREAVIDVEDWQFVKDFKWYAQRCNGGFYAATRWYVPGSGRRANSKIILMHRLLVKVARKQQVDHRNHDTLDNRRENLRACSPNQNQANRIIKGNRTTKYKGVYWNKWDRRWQARITTTENGQEKAKFLGGFLTAEAAAQAYNEAAREQWGEFALLNVI